MAEPRTVTSEHAPWEPGETVRGVNLGADPNPAPEPSHRPAPSPVPATGAFDRTTLLPTDPNDPYYRGNPAAVAAVQARFKEAYLTESGSGGPATQAAPEGPYELQRPGPSEVFTTHVMEDAAATGYELGFPQELTQQILDAHASGGELPELPMSNISPQAAESELRREWGDSYDERMRLARWAVKNCGEQACAVLSDTGLGNDPRVIRFFAREGARAMARHAMADKNSPYYNPGTRGHREQVAAVGRLFQMAQRAR